MPPLELTEKTVITILDLGDDNLKWSEFATARLGCNLRNAAGENPKGIMGFSARFLAIVGEFTRDKVMAAFRTENGLVPYFTLQVVVGKTAMQKHIASQPPPGTKELNPDATAKNASAAHQEHG